MAKHFERKDYKNVTKTELEIAVAAASDSCDDVRTTELFDRLMQKENPPPEKTATEAKGQSTEWST